MKRKKEEEGEKKYKKSSKDMMEKMKEEEMRAAKEGLTEEELELFDMLKKEKLTKDEEQKVKPSEIDEIKLKHIRESISCFQLEVSTLINESEKEIKVLDVAPQDWLGIKPFALSRVGYCARLNVPPPKGSNRRAASRWPVVLIHCWTNDPSDLKYAFSKIQGKPIVRAIHCHGYIPAAMLGKPLKLAPHAHCRVLNR
jgi:hypothetical protein